MTGDGVTGVGVTGIRGVGVGGGIRDERRDRGSIGSNGGGIVGDCAWDDGVTEVRQLRGTWEAGSSSVVPGAVSGVSE